MLLVDDDGSTLAHQSGECEKYAEHRRKSSILAFRENISCPGVWGRRDDAATVLRASARIVAGRGEMAGGVGGGLPSAGGDFFFHYIRCNAGCTSSVGGAGFFEKFVC